MYAQKFLIQLAYLKIQTAFYVIVPIKFNDTITNERTNEISFLPLSLYL